MSSMSMTTENNFFFKTKMVKKIEYVMYGVL